MELCNSCYFVSERDGIKVCDNTILTEKYPRNYGLNIDEITKCTAFKNAAEYELQHKQTIEILELKIKHSREIDELKEKHLRKQKESKDV